MNRLQTLLANKHTSAAALIVLVATVIGHIGPVWFPHYGEQLKSTADEVARAAMIYGLALAGDSKPANGNGASAPPPPTTPTGP